MKILLNSQHRTLRHIAQAANLLAWIALVIFILSAGERLFDLQLVGNNILFITRILFNTLSTLLKGVIYWLVLKGIACGLNMIVETDLNYRGRVEVGYDE